MRLEDLGNKSQDSRRGEALFGVLLADLLGLDRVLGLLPSDGSGREGQEQGDVEPAHGRILFGRLERETKV